MKLCFLPWSRLLETETVKGGRFQGCWCWKIESVHLRLDCPSEVLTDYREQSRFWNPWIASRAIGGQSPPAVYPVFSPSCAAPKFSFWKSTEQTLHHPVLVINIPNRSQELNSMQCLIGLSWWAAFKRFGSMAELRRDGVWANPPLRPLSLFIP